MKSFFEALLGNLVFFLEFLLLVAFIFLIAYFVEKRVIRNNNCKCKVITTRKITIIGIFSAISAVLMLFEIPVPFAPPFYKIDFSEVPILIVTFSFGPVAGVLTEFCKILLKLLFKSTSTAFVGELANFIIGCSFILPASIIYILKKDKKHAMLGCILGTLIMTIFGSAFNAFYLIPKFAQMFMPLEAIINMGRAINPNINSVGSLVLMSVVPLNLLKGVSVSIITVILYKKLSKLIKSDCNQ